MGDRARAFLEAWVQENVQIVAADEHEQVKAENLAAACMKVMRIATGEEVETPGSPISTRVMCIFLVAYLDRANDAVGVLAIGPVEFGSDWEACICEGKRPDLRDFKIMRY